MDEPLYFTDCYLREWEAVVSSAQEKYVALDRTAFYPNAGGQPFDTGTMERLSDNAKFNVVFVGKFGGAISHEVDSPGLASGDRVRCRLDWERRHIHMRMHTAAHILSKVIFDLTGARTSGNQLGSERSRIDFTLESLDRDSALGWVEEANRRIAGNVDVNLRLMPRDEAFRIPDLVRTQATLIPESVKTIRVVDIPGIDIEACGGTHVRNTGEIGVIRFEGIENKGKSNRRIYYSLADRPG